jgi:hypothetical protein
MGYKSSLKALRSGKAKLVLIAANTPPLRKSEIECKFVLGFQWLGLIHRRLLHVGEDSRPPLQRQQRTSFPPPVSGLVGKVFGLQSPNTGLYRANDRCRSTWAPLAGNCTAVLQWSWLSPVIRIFWPMFESGVVSGVMGAFKGHRSILGGGTRFCNIMLRSNRDSRRNVWTFMIAQ